ncbi:MAG: MFS transporter [Promethearchaeota archaeon]
MSNTIYEQPIEPDSKSFKMFKIFFVGQILSLLGSEIVQFSIVWWITVETGNPSLLSLSMFLTFLPKILFAPLAGILADRINKKFLIGLADFLQAVATLGLILMFFINKADIWTVISVNIIRSVFQTFHRPASASIIPLMVPKNKLSQMNGLQQLSTGIVSTVGPIIAAGLLLIFDISEILWFDVISFIVAFSLLLCISIPKISTKHLQIQANSSLKKVKKPSMIQDFKEGINVIRNLRGLNTIIILVLLANFLITPMIVLLSYFVKFDHNGSVSDLALVSGIMQAATIIGALVVSIRKEWKNKLRVFIIGILMIYSGIAIIGITPTGQFWIMYIGGFIACFGVPIITAMFLTLIQTVVPIDNIGRVSSNLDMLGTIFMPLGMLISGPIAAWIGTGMLFFLASVLGIIMTIILFFKSELPSLNADTFGSLKTESQLESQKSIMETIPVD